jgi:hypothetical protein
MDDQFSDWNAILRAFDPKADIAAGDDRRTFGGEIRSRPSSALCLRRGREPLTTTSESAQRNVIFSLLA